MNQPRNVMEGFEACLQAAKDWLAHKKFLKESGLEYEDELRRTRYPKGPWGWVQWRTQFAPTPGQDLSLVENALKTLREQHKLSQDEHERLRKLYGLDSITPEFCVECGAVLRINESSCTKCGHPVSERHGPELPASTTKSEFCTSCGKPVESDAEFCSECGAATTRNEAT